jgi:pimeloyl-ACP methyl ester carboxylesterase
VLLHGLGASGAVWQGIGRLLHPQLRLVAPDLRGHGESDKPSAGYLPRDYVSDVSAMLGHESTSPVSLLGHSLGALVAALVAAERPELVSRLVLVDPPFDPSRPRDHIAEVERLRHAEMGQLERYLQQRDRGMSELYARALANIFRSAADGAFQAVARAEPGYPALRESLPSIKVPTLVIAADPRLDAALSAEAATAVAEAIPDGRLVTIERAGHAVHATRPREFAEALLGFLTPAA